MDLITDLSYKRNTSVLVDGATYDVDAAGVMEDVDDDHAKKLLTGRAWRVWNGESSRDSLEIRREAFKAQRAAGHAAAVKANEAKDLAGIVAKELKRRGVDPEKAAKAVAAVKDAEGGEPKETAAQKKKREAAEVKAKDDAEAVALAKAVEDEETEAQGHDPAYGKEGGEWPDPLPTCSWKWLSACAEAYEVSPPEDGEDKAAYAGRVKKVMYS